VDKLNTLKGGKRINAMPQSEQYVLRIGCTIYLLTQGRLVNLGCTKHLDEAVVSLRELRLDRPGCTSNASA